MTKYKYLSDRGSSVRKQGKQVGTANRKLLYTSLTLECKGGLREAPVPVTLPYTPVWLPYTLDTLPYTTLTLV